LERTFALEKALHVRCRSCQRPIDIFSPPDLKIEPHPGTNRATLTRVDPANALCPECLVLTLPEEHRALTAEKFENHRVTAQEASIPPWATTYVMHSLGNPAVAWTRGYMLVMYHVHIPDWDTAPQLRPHMQLTPDDPNERPICFVGFAAEVLHEHVQRAFLQCIWPFDDVTLPARLQIVGGIDPGVSEADLITLVKGRRFLQNELKRVPGRPVGSTARDLQYYLEHYRELSRQLRRPVRQRELIHHLQLQGDTLNKTTLRRNLEAFNLWPWEKFTVAARRVDNRH
jgi:hypothetical protein